MPAYSLFTASLLQYHLLCLRVVAYSSAVITDCGHSFSALKSFTALQHSELHICMDEVHISYLMKAPVIMHVGGPSKRFGKL